MIVCVGPENRLTLTDQDDGGLRIALVKGADSPDDRQHRRVTRFEGLLFDPAEPHFDVVWTTEGDEHEAALQNGAGLLRGVAGAELAEPGTRRVERLLPALHVQARQGQLVEMPERQLDVAGCHGVTDCAHQIALVDVTTRCREVGTAERLGRGRPQPGLQERCEQVVVAVPARPTV